MCYEQRVESLEAVFSRFNSVFAGKQYETFHSQTRICWASCQLKFMACIRTSVDKTGITMLNLLSVLNLMAHRLNV